MLESELFFCCLAIGALIIFSFICIILPCKRLYDKAKEHIEIHNQGYEILDRKESFNRNGYPCFYYIVEYIDGCVEEIRVEPDVYYERVDGNATK